jgi:(p)ppGpp synthase/HD superfamily hydrolase
MEEIIAFAAQKHEGQVRKLSQDPYIVHPVNVANILTALNEQDELVKAAYLHDTLEDTDTTFEELIEKFGEKVAGLVKELTSDRSAVKEVGKAQYLTEKMNNMSIEALTIKLADRLDNVSDLNDSDIEFTQRYLKETEFIMAHLKRKLNKNQRRLYNLIIERIKTTRKNLKLD